MKKSQIKRKKNRFLPSMAALALLGSGALVYTNVASASTATPVAISSTATHIGLRGGVGSGRGFAKGSRVSGIVTAISGTSITLEGKNSTIYDVDIANAEITEKGIRGANPTAVTASTIVVGSRVLVEGTASGTSIIATNVILKPVKAPATTVV